MCAYRQRESIKECVEAARLGGSRSKSTLNKPDLVEGKQGARSSYPKHPTHQRSSLCLLYKLYANQQR